MKLYCETGRHKDDIRYAPLQDDGYRREKIVKRVSRSAANYIIGKTHGCWPNILVNTSVGFGLHVPVLDCDSVSEMLAAKHSLKKRGYNSTEIVSSKDRFWVVVDVKTSLKKMIRIIEITPGVDKNFAKLASKRSRIFIRAVPKGVQRPKFSNLDLGPALRWVSEFEGWFNSSDMDAHCEQFVINKQLREGTFINKTVADPRFVV